MLLQNFVHFESGPYFPLQLQQVETVLQSAGTAGQSDLLQLQKDLQEVIALTEGKINIQEKLLDF